jgi:hypothetical protein
MIPCVFQDQHSITNHNQNDQGNSNRFSSPGYIKADMQGKIFCDLDGIPVRVFKKILLCFRRTRKGKYLNSSVNFFAGNL